MTMPMFPGEDIGGVIEAFDTGVPPDAEFYRPAEEFVERIGADYGVPSYWSITNLQVQQILQRQLRRERAEIWINAPTGLGPPNVGNDNNNGAIAAATAGSVQLPIGGNAFLDGFDINLSTVGTAPMTVTVSNVNGGPFVYTIPTGGQSLSVRYAKPLSASLGTPTVSWSATAAAVGNVAIFGEVGTGSTGVIYLARQREPLQKMIAENFAVVPPAVMELTPTQDNVTWRSQQELFAVCNLAGPVTISVLDTIWGEQH